MSLTRYGVHFHNIAIRILESLAGKPIPGSLKAKAMSRDAICCVEDYCGAPISFDESSFGPLNTSQHKVVDAVSSREFRSSEGFLAVQGPPGTGECCI
jgi:hypothetical protein